MTINKKMFDCADKFHNSTELPTCDTEERAVGTRPKVRSDADVLLLGHLVLKTADHLLVDGVDLFHQRLATHDLFLIITP